jgi:hypothetical protein
MKALIHLKEISFAKGKKKKNDRNGSVAPTLI